MQQNLQRNIAMTFRVTEEERDLIRQKMKQSGIVNQRHFILKMLLEGRVIIIEMDSIRRMNYLLGNLSNNINQMARKANQMAPFYAREVNAIWDQFRELGMQQREIIGLYTDILNAVG